MAFRWMKLAAPLVILMVGLTGCGEEEPAGGNGNGGGTTESVTVAAQDFAFDPDTLDLEAGTEVEAAGGESASGSFTVPDSTVDWFCKYHPDQMTGTINVGGAAGGGTTEDDSMDDDMTESDKEKDGGGGGGQYDY